ncbi:hypothetical protein BpHYR1_022008 [Brachionus plicatilis]|uniref:Uncharacterized protein n=1 Tax=Brachionus plicatilis TaxID=10195 RepID=A0A3M7PM90_BRAPC|nr:hypothetical protein BpHYR1_022008 [Brachionus plicatilis]
MLDLEGESDRSFDKKVDTQAITFKNKNKAMIAVEVNDKKSRGIYFKIFKLEFHFEFGSIKSCFIFFDLVFSVGLTDTGPNQASQISLDIE